MRQEAILQLMHLLEVSHQNLLQKIDARRQGLPKPVCSMPTICLRWHMGAWRLNQDDNEEKQNYKAATDSFPLVTILQAADTLAARIIE